VVLRWVRRALRSVEPDYRQGLLRREQLNVYNGTGRIAIEQRVQKGYEQMLVLFGAEEAMEDKVRSGICEGRAHAKGRYLVGCEVHLITNRPKAGALHRWE
jgi:hypothetical protein